jgi:hypothetical protein
MFFREGPLKIFTHRWIFAIVGASFGFGGSAGVDGVGAGLGSLTATGTRSGRDRLPPLWRRRIPSAAASGTCQNGPPRSPSRSLCSA